MVTKALSTTRSTGERGWQAPQPGHRVATFLLHVREGDDSASHIPREPYKMFSQTLEEQVHKAVSMLPGP